MRAWTLVCRPRHFELHKQVWRCWGCATQKGLEFGGGFVAVERPRRGAHPTWRRRRRAWTLVCRPRLFLLVARVCFHAPKHALVVWEGWTSYPVNRFHILRLEGKSTSIMCRHSGNMDSAKLDFSKTFGLAIDLRTKFGTLADYAGLELTRQGACAHGPLCAGPGSSYTDKFGGAFATVLTPFAFRQSAAHRDKSRY